MVISGSNKLNVKDEQIDEQIKTKEEKKVLVSSHFFIFR